MRGHVVPLRWEAGVGQDRVWHGVLVLVLVCCDGFLLLLPLSLARVGGAVFIFGFGFGFRVLFGDVRPGGLLPDLVNR